MILQLPIRPDRVPTGELSQRSGEKALAVHRLPVTVWRRKEEEIRNDEAGEEKDGKKRRT